MVTKQSGAEEGRQQKLHNTKQAHASLGYRRQVWQHLFCRKPSSPCRQHNQPEPPGLRGTLSPSDLGYPSQTPPGFLVTNKRKESFCGVSKDLTRTSACSCQTEQPPSAFSALTPLFFLAFIPQRQGKSVNKYST